MASGAFDFMAVRVYIIGTLRRRALTHECRRRGRSASMHEIGKENAHKHRSLCASAYRQKLRRAAYYGHFAADVDFSSGTILTDRNRRLSAHIYGMLRDYHDWPL